MRRSRARISPCTRLLAAVLLSTVLGVPGCAGRSPDDGGQRDVVTAVVMPYLTLTAFEIAQQEGYFEQQGLQVEFVRMGRIQDVIPLLAHGDVDVAAGWVGANLMNSITHDTPVRVVAALGHLDPQACPFNAFVVGRELYESGALQDPERVRGLRFDVDPLVPQGYWADILLRPLGLTIDDVAIVNIPATTSVEALDSGRTDVMNISEPWVTVSLASGKTRIWRATSELLPGYTDSALFYGASLLQQRPEVGERFATAMLQAIRQFRRGKTPANVALVEQFTDLPRATVVDACWPVGPDDARVDVDSLRGFQEWLLEHGYIDRMLSDDELVDHRFIDAANARLSR